VFTEMLQITLMLLAVILAFLTVELENILYAVISFSGMCITIGAIFWILNAPYVAVFQLLIYAGAVVTVFLAAIMLTTRKETLK
jgi:NADH:ubiquinone oxidoreductase subunit 6 (subunit J)